MAISFISRDIGNKFSKKMEGKKKKNEQKWNTNKMPKLEDKA